MVSPVAGDPTEVDFAAQVIDNMAFLYNQFLSVVGTREVILNGSFESDADADTYPDGWVRTLYTGGTFTYEESVVAGDGLAWHGKRSISFTSPGGGGNGGGYVTSENFIEVSEGRPYKIQFASKSSVAGIHNKAEIKWYDSTQTLISTVIFHDESAANPTSWTVYEYLVQPPANSRYCKLIFYGAVDDDTTAGICYYDDVRILSAVPTFENRVMFNVSGRAKWTCPANAEWVAITVLGGGGGGGGAVADAAGGGGGGGGGMSFDIQRLTPGTKYAITVGIAGAIAAGTNNSGSAGGASTFAGTATLTGNGGSGGVGAGGTGNGGAGGTATGGRVNQTGDGGSNRSGSNGGDGGGAYGFGALGAGGVTSGSLAPTSGIYGGGGGGGRAGVDGATGSVGMVILRWG